MKSKSFLLKRLNNRFRYFSEVKLRDLSTIAQNKMVPNSQILNFYSAANNIGNYLPTLAIHNYLDQSLDCWNVHDKNIDYDFINKNYKLIIIGGAGLLHPCFESFWLKFSQECRIPHIVWGVGACVPDELILKDGAILNFFQQKALREAISRAQLVNLRDEWTAELVGAQDAIITPCPTLKLLSNYSSEVSGYSEQKGTKKILYAPHYELMTPDEEIKLQNFVNNWDASVHVTENNELPWRGMWRLIDKYLESDLVVTSRLHGAIIAWSLGVPFLALSKDKKMSEFSRLFAKGGVAFNTDELNDIEPCTISENDKKQHIRDLDQFANKALSLIQTLGI